MSDYAFPDWFPADERELLALIPDQDPAEYVAAYSATFAGHLAHAEWRANQARGISGWLMRRRVDKVRAAMGRARDESLYRITGNPILRPGGKR